MFDRPLIAFYVAGSLKSCFDPKDLVGVDGDLVTFMVSDANRGMVPQHALRANKIVVDLSRSVVEFRDTQNAFPYEVVSIDLTNYEVHLFRQLAPKIRWWQKLWFSPKETINVR